jgi:hypothetical protein
VRFLYHPYTILYSHLRFCDCGFGKLSPIRQSPLFWLPGIAAKALSRKSEFFSKSHLFHEGRPQAGDAGPIAATWLGVNVRLSGFEATT